MSPTLLTFKAGKPVKARLVITGSANWKNPLNLYIVQVDVGNNGKWDFSLFFGLTAKPGKPGKPITITKEFPVTIDAGGLTIKTLSTSSVSMVSSGSVTGILELRLLPAVGCAISSYGKFCGPLLSGTAAFNEIELRLTSAPANAFGVLLIGLNPLNIQIPGTFCNLNTDIVVTRPFTTNKLGEAMHTLPKLSFNVQDVLFQKLGNRFRITSTNGLRAKCK